MTGYIYFKYWSVARVCRLNSGVMPGLKVVANARTPLCYLDPYTGKPIALPEALEFYIKNQNLWLVEALTPWAQIKYCPTRQKEK